MRANRITLVRLGVADLERSRAFDAELGGGDAVAAFLDMDGMMLGLQRLDVLARDLDREPAALGTGAMTPARNFPTEAQVDAAYERALEAGASVRKRPEAVFWGGCSGTCANPDGHVREAAMNPFWTLDEDGRLSAG